MVITMYQVLELASGIQQLFFGLCFTIYLTNTHPHTYGVHAFTWEEYFFSSNR